MSQEQTPCTVETCDRPTQESLCAECTTELQDAWDQIEPLLPTLLLISRNQEQAFTQKTAGGRGGATGSKPPMNLSALQLHINLGQALVFTPDEYARHDDGAWSKWMIEDQVKRASLMVFGEDEDKQDDEYLRLRVKIMPVLSPTDMVEWFASEEGPGIAITEDQLKNWKHRGRLYQHNKDGGRPKYHAADVYLAYQNRGSTGWEPSPTQGNQAYSEEMRRKEAEKVTNHPNMV